MAYQKGELDNLTIDNVGGEMVCTFDYEVFGGKGGPTSYSVRLYFPDDDSKQPYGDILEAGGEKRVQLGREDTLYFSKEVREVLVEATMPKTRFLAIAFGALTALFLAIFLLVPGASGLVSAF